MRVLDELPLYIVSAAVLINLLFGMKTGVGFSTLMIRSIIVTIVFSITGYILSGLLRNAVHESRQNHEQNNRMKNGSTIDIQVPPMDDEILSNLSQQEDEDDFSEINPAYLHSYRQKENTEE